MSYNLTMLSHERKSEVLQNFNATCIYDITSLTNKGLIENVVAISKGLQVGLKSTWLIAESIFNSIENGLYKDDFIDKKDFIKYLGFSKGTISKYYNAYKFYLNYLKDNNINTCLFTTNKAYMLSSLNEKLNDFMIEYGLSFESIENIIEKDLQLKIKEFNKNNKAIENETAENETAENETAENETAENETAKNIDNIISLNINGCWYDIPQSVLDNYKR